MKKKQFNLLLTNSCNQSWTDLNGLTEKRYCSKCDKNVTDIIGKSDEEIIKLLQQGKSCVRVTKEQLEKKYYLAVNQNIAIPYIKTFALASFALIAVNVNATNDSEINPKEKIELFANSTELKNEITIKQDTVRIQINGKLIDKETRKPLPYANVIISGSKFGDVTDFEGNFKFTVPTELISDTVKIEISYIGYQTTEYQITRKDIDNGIIDLEILMQENVLLGEVIIIEDNKKNRKRNKKKNCP